MDQKQVLHYLNISSIFGNKRTKEILQINPTVESKRVEATKINVSIYDYNSNDMNEYHADNVKDAFGFKSNGKITWINIDGIKKDEVTTVCDHYNIHPLLLEDVLSVGQRPKMDEINGILFCLLNMLYYNSERHIVETEQISIALGRDFVLSIQEDSKRDVFKPLRVKFSLPTSKIRQSGADYLLYSMLDLIIDNYFIVMENLGNQIEHLEESIIQDRRQKNFLTDINQLRKELIILKRNITPVRDLIAGIIRSESTLLDDKNHKYFKDIHDHIVQAFELSENYSDMLVSIQDLYISNVNLRLNQVIKVMTIVTCLLAPAMVIGGIFGMNFDVIPYAHQKYGFYATVSVMVIIALLMLRVFKKYKWF